MPDPYSSPAAQDLGLGGTLTKQVAEETEEMRKKRMQEMQMKQQLGPAGSMAVTSLFGMGKPGAGN
jgi:hypothetical protein